VASGRPPLGDRRLAAAMGHELAGILAVAGGINHRRRLLLQVVIDIDKSEQTGVGQGLGGLGPNDTLRPPTVSS